MAEGHNLEKIWKATLAELEVELGKSNFALYFKNSQLLSLDNGVARIGLPNKGIVQQVNQRYYTLIQGSLQKASQQDKLSLIFEVIAKPAAATIPEETNIGPLFDTPKKEAEAEKEAGKRAHLRLDFTFANFCVSTSNHLAFAAAQAVAKTPGQNYNPFFIWGGVGVGKTHLMQAIGHEIIKKNPRAKIICAPCEQFTNEIIEGIRNKNTKVFKEKYRSADALLIDDVQFLSGKDTAQEEFFHTFNAISQNEGQIILTSDCKPSDIKDIFDRLRSRFEGGMVADISTPDHELKVAICLLKAKKRGVEISNDTASVIADNVDNIRTLEGTLQKIIAESELQKKGITLGFAQKILELPVSSTQSAGSRLDSRFILDAVCAYYELPIKLIKGEKRDKPIAESRQVLMYLLKKNTRMTLQEIAAFLEKSDHTTIIHGVKKIEALLLTSDRIRTDVEELTKRLEKSG